MSESNDTSTIDEKKDENNGSSKQVDIGGFIYAFVVGLIGIYIFKVFKQVQGRPNAIIKRIY